VGSVECPRCGRVTEAAGIWLWVDGQGERLRVEDGRIVQSGHVAVFDLACGCKFDTDLWALGVLTSVSPLSGTKVTVRITAVPAVRRGEEFAGYVVAGRDGGPILKIDWDGHVHPTSRDAEISLLECHRDGYEDYGLYGLVQIEPTDG